MLRLAVLALGLLFMSDAAFAANSRSHTSGKHFEKYGNRAAPQQNGTPQPKGVGGGTDGQPGGGSGIKLSPIQPPSDPYNTNGGGGQTGGGVA
jgi:hypothetical protein